MKHVKITIGIIISIVFIYFTVKGIEWQKVLEILKSGNYIFIVPSVLIHMSAFYIRSYKWSILLNKVKKIKLLELFDIVAIGFMMNNIFPLRAGEFGRIIITSNKYKISKIKSSITIVIERLFDIIGLLTLVLILIYFRTWPDYINTIVKYSGIFIFLAILLIPLFLIYIDKIINSKLFNKIDIKFIREKLKELKNGYFIYNDRTLIIKSFLLSILLWIVEGSSYFILSKVFDINISFLDFLFICAISNLASAIPSAPGYIGTFDLITKNVLVFVGLSQSVAFSFVLILHIELLIPITIIGIYIYIFKNYHKYLTFKQIEKLEADE